MNQERVIIGSIIFACAFLIATSIVLAVRDEQNWQSYKQAHHCHSVGTKAASNGYGGGVDGRGNYTPVVTYIPSQTIYQCDDGELVIR